MNILLIEDTPVSARSMQLTLAAEGHNIALTATGEEGVEMAALYDYDAILLDLDLEDMDGLAVIRELRLGKVRTPVIVVTACAEIEPKVKALSSGADDYLVKPFYKAELVARVNAVVRRSRGHAQSTLRSGEIELDLDTHRVRISGQHVHLTPSEYKVLQLLTLRKNTVLTKEMCLNHLYNGMSDPEIKIIDVFICKLRKKISAATGGDGAIKTVWGGGYMLEDPADRPQQLAA